MPALVLGLPRDGGGPDGLAVGPPDDFEAIGRALGELQGQGKARPARMYVVSSGPGSTAAVNARVAQFAAIGVPLTWCCA